MPYAIFEVDERHSGNNVVLKSVPIYRFLIAPPPLCAEKKGDAVVSVKEEGGMLKAHGTKDVVFSITPHDTGRQTYNISVMNMKTMTPVRSMSFSRAGDPAPHQLLISHYSCYSYSCLPQRIVSVTLSVEKSRGLRYPDLVTGKADLYNLSSTGRIAHL